MLRDRRLRLRCLLLILLLAGLFLLLDLLGLLFRRLGLLLRLLRLRLLLGRLCGRLLLLLFLLFNLSKMVLAAWLRGATILTLLITYPPTTRA